MMEHIAVQANFRDGKAFCLDLLFSIQNEYMDFICISGPGSVSKECKKETTPWSACSVSCGMGVSMRVTNDNEDCQPVQQRRLCFVRPCELNDKHLVSRRWLS